jgi:polysaccharide biosynthesis protein PslH
VADFTYAPNREGLEFLVGEVMPQVWRVEPRLRLLVAGRAAPHGWDERVELLGFVEDLDPLYERAACALVPLLSGGGSPLKFIDGLAHGVPVVATPRAAAGVDAEPGRHYVEGSGADGFASALVETLDPPRGAELGAAGRALAQSEYSIESLARRLAA